MVRWYWSADALFWQLSIDHNIDVQLVFSWAPKIAKSVRVNIGCPVVRTDGRSAVGGRCTVTWLPNFLGWVDLLSYGAAPTRARGAPLWHEKWKHWKLNVCVCLFIIPSEVIVYATHQVLILTTPPEQHSGHQRTSSVSTITFFCAQ